MDKRILPKADADERQSFVDSATHNAFIMDGLKDALKKIIEEKDKAPLADYDKASWPYLRADKDGQIRAYRDVLSMLESIKPK